MIFLRFSRFSVQDKDQDLAIHKFTKLISENQEIPFYGDGSTARDYTFIEDIIDGVVKSVKYVENHHNVYETINLGESEVVNLNEMVTGIEQELGKSAIKKSANAAWMM